MLCCWIPEFHTLILFKHVFEGKLFLNKIRKVTPWKLALNRSLNLWTSHSPTFPRILILHPWPRSTPKPGQDQPGRIMITKPNHKSKANKITTRWARVDNGVRLVSFTLPARLG
jgi:hypothetical protein